MGRGVHCARYIVLVRSLSLLFVRSPGELLLLLAHINCQGEQHPSHQPAQMPAWQLLGYKFLLAIQYFAILVQSPPNTSPGCLWVGPQHPDPLNRLVHGPASHSGVECMPDQAGTA